MEEARVGESRELWVKWSRPTRNDNTGRVPVTPTVNTFTVTTPAGAVTTLLIGNAAVRATETNQRYATDVTLAAGTTRVRCDASGSYVDDDGNTRNWTGVQAWEIRAR